MKNASKKKMMKICLKDSCSKMTKAEALEIKSRKNLQIAKGDFKDLWRR
jgi:hypothetical protein